MHATHITSLLSLRLQAPMHVKCVLRLFLESAPEVASDSICIVLVCRRSFIKIQVAASWDDKTCEDNKRHSPCRTVDHVVAILQMPVCSDDAWLSKTVAKASFSTVKGREVSIDEVERLAPFLQSNFYGTRKMTIWHALIYQPPTRKKSPMSDFSTIGGQSTLQVCTLKSELGPLCERRPSPYQQSTSH